MSSQTMSHRVWSISRQSMTSVALTALLLLSAGPAMAQDYTVSTNTLGFTSISTTGTQIPTANFMLAGSADADDGFVLEAAPFDFDFFGTTVTMGTDVRIHVNGLLTPGGATTSDDFATVSAINNSLAPDNSIFLCWADLDMSTSGAIYTEVQGTAPNRTWIIEYSMIPALNTAGAVFDAQVAIAETSGVIELRYSAANDFMGEQVVIGMKNANGTIGRGHPVSIIQTANPTDNGVFTPSAGFPNLVVTNVVPSAASVQAGDMLSLDFDIENTGVNDSTTFDVVVYLSLDATIDINDQPFTGTPLSLQLNVGAQQSTTVTATVPVPNPVSMLGRAYFVGVFADPTNAQNDPNVLDNAASASLLVGPEPYLVRREAKGAFSSILSDQNTVILASDTLNPRDDGEVGSVLPFDFRYFGQMFTANTPIAIGYNGYVELNDASPTTSSGFSNTNLPSSATTPGENFICGFWDDLEVNTGHAQSISELTTGTAPNRKYIIEYNMLTRTGAASNPPGYTFQIVLEETSNAIRFIYDSTLPFAGTVSGTVGLEGPANGESLQLTTAAGGLSFTSQPTTNFLLLENGNTNLTVDLTASNVSVAQTAANAGSSIDVSRQIDNIGTTDSGAVDIAFVLSTDQIIDGNDMVIGTSSVANIAAGANIQTSSAVAIPVAVAPGTYFVGVIANAGSTIVPESDYFNNDAPAMMSIVISGPSKDEGDINDDDLVNVADVMANINFLLTDDTNPLGDVNNDNVVNIFDVQITINRVLAAP